MFVQIFSLKTPSHSTKNALTNKKFIKAFYWICQKKIYIFLV